MANDGQMMPLGEVAHIVMGLSPKGDTYNHDGRGEPLLNGPTEFGPTHPIPVLFTTSPSRFAEPGDILFCVRGSTTGRMNWADRRYAIGRGIAAIRAKTNNSDTYFIYCSILADLPRLLSLTSGSVFPSLSAGDFAAFEIPWPDSSARDGAVRVLRSLDDKIELNRRMNRTLEKMAAAIFKSWFIDFDLVHAKAAPGNGRDRASGGLPAEIADLFPDSFEDSLLGPIPKGWKVSTLGSVCAKPQYGYTASASDSPVGPRFLRITDINKRPWIDWGAVPFCEASQADIAKYRLQKGDIVIARMADPGHAALIEDDECAVFASYLIRFRPLQSDMSRYLQYWLHSDAYWNLIHARKTGSTRATLNAQVLAELPLVRPSDTVASAFERLIGPLRDRVTHNARQNRRLAGLRDTLLPKLLSGEIELPAAEELAEGVK